MKRARITTVVLVLGLVMLAAAPGCKLKRNPPDKKAYVLDVSPPADSAAISTNLRVYVSRIKVSPIYAGKGFVYRGANGIHESDFHSEFFSTPENVLTEEVRRWLAAMNSTDGQLVVFERNQAGYILQGRVTELFGDYGSDARQAVLAADFVVTRGPGAEGPVAFRRGYRETEGVDGTPEALVQGWNRALERILDSLAGELAKLEDPPPVDQPET